MQAEQPHPDADFRVDGVPLAQVSFVGRIRSVTTQPTNHTYTLDDGTGAVEVKQWIDPDVQNLGGMDMDGNETEKSSALPEGVYARVFGNLKQFNNKRHVGVRAIRATKDYNEVQCHLLDATVVHLNLTRGPPGQRQKGNTSDAAMQGIEMNGGSGEGQAGGRQLPAGLSPAARRVYQCLNTADQTNEGLHMHDIASRLGMDLNEVAKGGDELLNHGMVYTTVDDHTWAILDDM